MSMQYRGIKQNGIKRDYHRVVMEAHIGRRLTRYEVVHHINGDGMDNRIENLQLMTLSEHTRMHSLGHVTSDETRAKLSAASSKQDGWLQSKMSREEAAEAKRLVESGLSYRKVAKTYGICHRNLQRTIRRLNAEGGDDEKNTLDVVWETDAPQGA